MHDFWKILIERKAHSVSNKFNFYLFIFYFFIF